MSSPKKCLLSLIRDINFLFFIYVVHLYTHLSVASASSSASATTRLIMPKRSIVAAGTRSEVTRHISSRRGPRQEGLTTESLHQSWSLSPGKLASAAKGGAVRSVRKAVAEHREPALRTVARGLVLDNVPVFGELAIFNTNYVDHDPVYRGAES